MTVTGATPRGQDRTCVALSIGSLPSSQAFPRSLKLTSLFDKHVHWQTTTRILLQAER